MRCEARGCFLVPPDDGADLGVLFWHKDGYSTACGHGTITLGSWAVRSDRVPSEPNGTTDVVIDVPSGRVSAQVTTVDGVVTRLAFKHVGARHRSRHRGPDGARAVHRRHQRRDAIYASLPAASAGLAVAPAHPDDPG